MPHPALTEGGLDSAALLTRSLRDISVPMVTSNMASRATGRGIVCGALFGALLTSQCPAAAHPAEQPEPGPATAVADPPARAEGGSSSARPYRVVQVVGAALFGVSYVGSLVSALIFRDATKTDTEKRRAGYLAYPIAGPFIALGVYEGGAQLFVPIGITQGIGALGFLVGTIGAATVESESDRSGFQVMPMAGPGGAGLQATWHY